MPYYGWDEKYLSLVRQTIREFCKKELTREYVRWMDENCDFPPDDLWKKLGEIDAFQWDFTNPYANLIIQEELATASAAVMIAIGASVHFGMGFIAMIGNPSQQAKYLPRLMKGELKMCMALTEPTGGTDILNALQTTAVEDGDYYVLNGQKVFITAAHVADYLITIAITDPEAPKKDSWSVFIVDAKTPGITVRKIPKLGIHACACNEIFYDNVRVHKDNMLGRKNKAYQFLVAGERGKEKKAPSSDDKRKKGNNAMVALFNMERVSTAILSLGIANAAYQDALAYAKQRMAFGRPIGQFQIIQHYLVEMAIQIENARNMIYGSISRSLAGYESAKQAQMAKIVAARASEYCAIKGMEILGGYGYTMEYDMQRYFRDYKQMVFAPITDEMAINVIAHMLGLPKSY